MPLTGSHNQPLVLTAQSWTASLSAAVKLTIYVFLPVAFVMTGAPSTNPKSWSVEQVVLFCDREVLFKDMGDIFVENEVDGQGLLELTTAKLRDDLHVKSLGKRKAMLRRLAELAESSQGVKQEVPSSKPDFQPPLESSIRGSPRVTKCIATCHTFSQSDFVSSNGLQGMATARTKRQYTVCMKYLDKVRMEQSQNCLTLTSTGT